MYSVKYEVMVLLKKSLWISIDPILLTKKSSLSSLHWNDELDDYKLMVFLSVSSAMFYLFVSSDTSPTLF